MNEEPEDNGTDIYAALGEESHDEPPEDKDHKKIFHGLAEEQKGKDDQEEEESGLAEDTKSRVKAMLESVKGKLTQIEKIKETDPEVFDVFVNMVKSILDLAQKIK